VAGKKARVIQSAGVRTHPASSTERRSGNGGEDVDADDAAQRLFRSQGSWGQLTINGDAPTRVMESSILFQESNSKI